MLRTAGEFSGLFGVNFDPFIAALTAADLPGQTRSKAGAPPLKMLTGECLLYDIDLANDPSVALPEIEVRLPIRHRGVLGSVEVFFRAHFDETTQLTNAPYIGTTHWRRLWIPFATPITVDEGEMVPIVARLETHLGKQHLVVEPA